MVPAVTRCLESLHGFADALVPDDEGVRCERGDLVAFRPESKDRPDGVVRAGIDPHSSPEESLAAAWECRRCHGPPVSGAAWAGRNFDPGMISSNRLPSPYSLNTSSVNSSSLTSRSTTDSPSPLESVSLRPALPRWYARKIDFG